MSTNRPAQPGPPKRLPSAPVPPNARKSSQPIQPGPAGVQSQTQAQGQSSKGGRGSPAPRFYDGPTVARAAEGIPDYSKEVAKKTVETAKVQTRKAVKVVRRHPWSIASLITSIPFLVFLSLFSTVVCPPPGPQGPILKYVLSPIGLGGQPAHGSLHQTLCYPANVYNSEVLEPYVWPLVDRAQQRVVNHPVYVKGVEPAYQKARATSQQVWDGPVGPVVRRVQREVRRAYLTFVQPHIPYVKAKVHTFTAPYTTRVAALHNQYLHPQIAAAQLYANSAKDQSFKSYNYIAAHPVTGQAGKYANLGYQTGRKRSIEAYNWSRPHVIRGAKEAERVTREIVGPRAIKGLQLAGDQAAKGYNLVKARVVALYYAHLDPHVGPHIRRASLATAPHLESFNQKVYRPYIRPTLEAILPEFLFTPEPPRTFWAMIADFLPSAGSHAAERKGSLDDGYGRAKADVKSKTESVKTRAASATASASSAAAKKAKMTRAEMDKKRDSLKDRIEEQGKKGYKQVKSELVNLNKEILTNKFPMLQQGSRAEIEQDINYVVGGLDKLYSRSPVLTRDQVVKSSTQADTKIQAKVSKVKSKLDGLKHDWFEAGRPIVRRAFEPLDKLLVEKDQLAEDMAWVDDVTPKDWAKFNTQLQPAADGWKDKYMGLHKGTVKDRQMTDPAVNVDKNLADLFTELDDMVEAFRRRVGILKRTAMDRIEARQALASESSSSSSSSASKSSSSSSESGRVSILPIAAEAAGAAGAAAVIGKGKYQVEDALRQASKAVVGETTPTGVAQQARSVAEEYASSASSVVHDATRSAVSVAGGTPSPEGVHEHAESIYHAVSHGAGSVVSAASSAVHEGTRSALSAVGATPSPEGAEEYLESIAAGVQQGAASVYAQAGSVAHDASRSAVSAVGGTPSPEGAVEYAQSVAGQASASASSVVDQAASSAASVADQAASSASSVGSVISDAVHEATRSIVAAAGGTPSPENVAEHAQSLASAASASASSIGSVASRAVHDGTRSVVSAAGGSPSPESVGDYISAAAASASSVGSVVSQAVHDGTQSAISALGGTPVPDAAGAYARSVADQATLAASSVGSVVSAAIHDGTRSVISVAGGTPSPESPGEHVQSLSAQAASLAAELKSLAASDAVPSVSSALAAGSSAGSSLLDSLSSQMHTATRSLAKQVGATASPEGMAERLEDVVRRLGEIEENVEEAIKQALEEGKEGAKKVLGRDEL